MTRMTPEDRKAVAEASELVAAEWWCLLNRWEWPLEGLGEPDPVPEPRTGTTRRGEIMCEISERIGMRECLREWNREHLPGLAFDQWWDSGEAAQLHMEAAQLRLVAMGGQQ